MSDKASTSSGGGDGVAAAAAATSAAAAAPSRKTPTPGANVGAGTTTTQSSTTSTSGQDQHPYARGAVIEVLHQPGVSGTSSASGTKQGSGAAWWSDPDSSEDEADVAAVTGSVGTAHTNTTTSNASTNENDDTNNNNQVTVRLCDIIDRAQRKDGTWRYYIHYRDFNRRMDEWIDDLSRIVSPPSVGNAKARALAAQERALKRQREQQAVLETPRGRRKTAGAATPVVLPGESDGDGRRPTRLSRRKSSHLLDDDATVATSHVESGAGGGSDEDDVDDVGDLHNNTTTAGSTGTSHYSASTSGGNSHHGSTTSSHKHKEVLVIGDNVTTHTVGEHVVATLQAQELDEHEGLDEASLREHEEVTKVKNVAFMELGYYQMETWYFSPLPKELVGPSGFLEILYVCEFTLSFFARKVELQRFQDRIPTEDRHPPGNEIYRSGNIAMFEVDGQEEKIYSQNLCYIAKLFLDHKTLYFDVDPFLFYVLCEVDERGYHPVGYFSKEKYSDVGYNLACILTFPAHQRKGYGRFLIAFSYELSKKEEKVGSPEKPMSDLGQQAYKPYWASTIIDFLLKESANESSLSVMDISKRTSIMAEDIVFTLNQLGLLKMMNGVYFIAAEENLLKRLAQKFPIKKPFIDPSALHWTPFLTDVKRDKFSVHSKKASVADDSLPRATPVPSASATTTSSKAS